MTTVFCLLSFPLFSSGNAPPAMRDVSWLAEVNTPPKTNSTKPAATLRPLLVNADGKPIRTLGQWTARRRELRAAWMKFLGPMPAKRPPVKLTVLRTDRLPGVTRQLVQYESEAGLKVEGYLLRPVALPGDIAKSGKRPALVALHATSRDTIDQIAGVKGKPSQQLGLRLARRGFVVFCPRCFLWQNARSLNDAVAQFRKRHPRTLGMHKMLYDAMRGVDVLESLPDVDSARIGAVGHSLGAKETLYLAAFDERIRAAVASEGGVGLGFTNWDAPWYLGKGIHAAGFARNHHELLALIAPRPFLVLAGETGPGAADGARTWPYLAAAQAAYRLHPGPPRLGMLNHREGHSIPPKAFTRMAEWLETYLQANGGRKTGRGQ